MKYRIIILSIIIISLGQILVSYIANTSRTHARTSMRARAHTHTHRRLRSGSMRRWRPSVTKLTPSCMAGSWVIQISTRSGDPISRGFGWSSRRPSIQNCQPERRRELVAGCTVRRYEQLDTSSETIEQELRPAVANADRQT